MDNLTKTYFETLKTEDPELRRQAFEEILAVTNVQVDWAYDVWDEMKSNLSHPNNHVRAIAALAIECVLFDVALIQPFSEIIVNNSNIM